MATTAAKATRVMTIDWRRFGAPVGVLAVLVSLVGGGALLQRYLTDPMRFPVRVIEVRGEFRHLDRQRLEQAVASAIGDGFVSADMADIRRRIEGFAWVEGLELRRIWPDRLRLTVSEQVPVARWGPDGLVNRFGVVFRPQPAYRPADMPLLHGADETAPKVVTFLADIVPHLDGAGLRVESVRLDDLGDWQVRLRSGLQLAVGPERPIERLRRFLALYPVLRQEQGRMPARVDLRYGHGIAVRWKLSGINVSEQPRGGTPR